LRLNSIPKQGESVSRNTQLVQMLRLIGNLSAAPKVVRPVDLISKNGINRRTLERDMQALADAETPAETLPDGQPKKLCKRVRWGAFTMALPASTAKVAAAHARATGTGLRRRHQPADCRTRVGVKAMFDPYGIKFNCRGLG
jgi:hypothetical protein